MINVAGITHNDLANGPGIRCTLYVQGCGHKCKGCHNPNTWKYGIGKDMAAEDIFAQITANKLNQGVTISGGEPIDQYLELIPLTELLVQNGYDLIVYTGYTKEALQSFIETKENFGYFLKKFDYIICDPFDITLKDYTLKFRGSRNQRVVTMDESTLEDVTEKWDQL